MIRLLYTLVLTLVLPVLVLRLFARARKAPAYRERIGERLGRQQWPAHFDKQRSTIWIHAVSVGETVAASPLVTAILTQWPASQIVFTTMTPTGSERVKELFGDSVLHCYLPYDSPLLLAPLLRRTNPDLFIVMETELWPNLLHCCQQQQIPVMLANGRLSEKSARGYQRIAGLSKTMLNQFAVIAAQADSDAERFIQLGAPADKLQVTGSLKFNVAAVERQLDSKPFFVSLRKAKRPVLIAASTREKEGDAEEAKVFAAFKVALSEKPDLLLLIVPRHPERFTEVASMANAAGFVTQRRSVSEQLEPDTQVVVGDSMGEMDDYYQSASVAFVGGSLVDTGCQNVLEPAALGLPILVGPSQFNFATICQALGDAGALLTVPDSVALGESLKALLEDPKRMARMGAAGRKLVEANQQALPRHLEILRNLLPAAQQ